MLGSKSILLFALLSGARFLLLKIMRGKKSQLIQDCLHRTKHLRLKILRYRLRPIHHQ